MQEGYSFLGKGWSFPPTFDYHTQDVVMVTEEEDIVQSLKILLGTRPGERIMQPRFGCNLDVLLFEPLTATLSAYVQDLVETSILLFEPRIKLNRLEISADALNEGVVLIELDYSVRTSNSRFNLVLPFYINKFNRFFEQNDPKEFLEHF